MQYSADVCIHNRITPPHHPPHTHTHPPLPVHLWPIFYTHKCAPHSPIYSTDVCLKRRFHATSCNPRCLALCRWKVWLLATLKWSDKFTTALPGKSRLTSWPEKLPLIGSLLFFSYAPTLHWAQFLYIYLFFTTANAWGLTMYNFLLLFHSNFLHCRQILKTQMFEHDISLHFLRNLNI